MSSYTLITGKRLRTLSARVYDTLTFGRLFASFITFILIGSILAGCGGGGGGAQPAAASADPSAPAIASSNSATFTVGAPSTFIVVASGTPAAAITETGALPSGVAFTSNGNGTANLSGTPPGGAAGAYPLMLTAHNGIGTDSTENFVLTVDQSAAITSANSTTFTAGASGAMTVTATGYPAPVLSESGALPSGISFNPSTGVLSGTPAIGVGGTNTITFSASNGIGSNATQSFTITINQAPSITSAANMTFTVGSLGTFTVAAAGYPAPTFAESGALPSGVTFSSSTGTLGGTPTTSGTFPITFTASNGVGTNATQSFTLSTNQAAVITSPNSATFTVGSAGSLTVAATGFPAPAVSETGTLPPGVTFNLASGTLSGTPTTSGTFPITFSASNGIGAAATQNFTLSVNQSAAITSPTNSGALAFVIATAKSVSVTAAGAPTPTLSMGMLPAGITFTDHGDGTGSLGGTPSMGTVGSYPVIITAHNGVGTDATQAFTLAVSKAAATVSVSNLAQTFDGTPRAATAATVPPGLAVIISYSGSGTTVYGPSATPPTSVGSYVVSATINDPNYSGSDPDILTIMKATPVLTWASPAAITYGTALSATQLDAAATIPGSFAYNPSTGATPTAGSQTLSATFTPTDTTDYSSATATVSLTVNKASPTVTWPMPAPILSGVALSATQLNATANIPGGFVYTPVAGTIPLPGSQTLSVAFTPTDTTDYSDANASVTLTVDQAAAVTSTNAATFAVGSPGAFSVTAAGFPTPSLSESGTLPAGVAFNTSSGVLSGSPTVGGIFPITFTASNGVSANATQNFTLTVNQAPVISSANSATFVVGTAAAFNVTSTGTPAATFSESGTLPSGVTFTSGGILGGTASAGTIGSYPIVITANNGISPNAIQNFTLVVNAAPVPATISSANSVTFAVGSAGTFTIVTAGSPTPTLSQSGTLPAGVTLNSANGILSGTPTASGSYPITLTAHNGVGTDATQSFTLIVNQVAAITSANTATFIMGSSGAFSVAATGYPAPVLSEAGALPSGLSFNASTGTLSGTPTASGSYPLTFTAHNGIGADATQSFVLTVNQATTITSASSATFTVGAAVALTVTANGYPVPTVTESGSLPSGVTFNASTRILGGTPTGSGSYPLTFTAHNGVGADAIQSFALTVNQVAAFSSVNNVTFTLGSVGTFSVTASGSPVPTLSESGTLPNGVTFNPSTGVLSGTPTVNGSYPLTFTAHNAVGSDATQNFTLTVNQAAALTSANFATFTVGSASTFAVTAIGFPAPTLSESGTVPSGLTFNASTGTIGGTPAAAGTFPIALTAHNGIGTDATQTLTLTVNQVAAITSANSTSFKVGTGGTFTVAATGFPAPALSESGPLPNGVSFNASTGVLSGTPTVSGTYPVTFTAHNGIGADATQSFTLTVNQAAAITSTNTATFTVGSAGNFTVMATGSPVPSLSEVGALPNGLTFSPSTGTLGGTPTVSGSYPITFNAHNGVGSDATQSLALTVNQVAAITSVNNATFTVGSAANFAVVVTGFPAPTLSVTGALPSGLTFNSATGAITGTATSPGTFPITLTAHNGVGSDATQSFILTVNQVATITSANNTTFVVGTSGTFTVSTTGFPAPAIIEAGALPSGITFNPGTGVLSGTSTANGSYPVTFTAHNGVGADAIQSFTLTVNQAAAITNTNNTTFTTGAASTFTITATGSPAPVLSESGALPSGVSFNTSTGVLGGIPTANGAFPVTFTAHNGVGVDATQSFILTVNQVAAINSANTAMFTLGTPGTFTVTTSGFPAPVLSESGTLPTGVSFNASTGVLTGTPTINGSYSINFTAHNGVGTDATQSFILNVDQTPTITSANNTTLIAGSAGTFSVTTAGFPSPTLTESGTLPAGVTFNTSTGILSGTPTAGTGGTYAISFIAGNGVGSNASQSFTLTVEQAAAIISTNTATFTVGTAGTFTVAASGYTVPILSEQGTLPTGISFNASTGVLSGTPTASGSYLLTFTARNGVSADATQSFTLTVTQASAITSANNTTFTVGVAGTFTGTVTGSPTPALSGSGALPSGVTFNPLTDILSGTPAEGSGGVYTVTLTASNGVGSNAIQVFILTVDEAPAITSSTTATFTEAKVGVFALQATGTPAPSFTESGTLPAGLLFAPTTGTLSGTPAVGSSGTYSLTFAAHNGIGADASQNFTLTINAAPVIATQPVGQTVNVGQTATFTVTATGTSPVTYQWEKGGVAIPNATLSTYTTPPTTAADDGAQFVVVATNLEGSTTSAVVTLSVNTAPAITTQPASQTVTAGGTATFMVAVTGTGPFTFQWSVAGIAIPSATQSAYTTPATTISNDGTQYTVQVSNAVATTTSSAATLSVNPLQSVDVVTYHNDNSRTGQNLLETILTPANVQSASFGNLGLYPVDGKVDAQPLYLSNVAIPSSGTHDVLYVVTEHDSVYAFDASTGAVLWNKSLLGNGETPSDPRGCSQVTLEIGITATPVIDRVGGTIYIVAMSKDGANNYYQRLHALDIATGNEKFSGPTTIQATYPGTGANNNGQNVVFDPAQYKERAGLLLLNGVVYTAWASHCDIQPYTGWIMGYNESTLAQTSVLNVTPNGSQGAIWMSGAGLAADSAGNIYLLDGNGTFDTALNANGFPAQGDYGNSFLKLSTTGGLQVSDYFEMSNQGTENGADVDLGSGGALLLPDITDNLGAVHHLAVGAGKDQNIYIVNRDSMGKFNSASNDIYQEINGIFPGTNPAGIYSMPAYFNNTVYFGSVGNPLMAFGISNALLSTAPTSQTLTSFGYPGTTPGVSANGSSSGIVWTVENNSQAAVLHAYDATNLAAELYNSNQAAGGRDSFGPGNKFITPTIANGRVYVGTPSGVAVFGLLPSYTATQTLPSITTQPANQTINVGQAATFMVAATGTGPLSYQWQANGLTITGANSSTYTTPAVTAADDGITITVIVSDVAGSSLSNIAKLTVNTPPAIVTSPVSQSVTVGEIATFTVVATGTPPPTYQWQMNGINIPGAIGSTYVTPILASADNGEQYTVQVTNFLGSLPSGTAQLSVTQPASPAIYYVDGNSGLDTNNGTSQNSPWRHAPGMNGCASNCGVIVLNGGDKIVLKGGVTWGSTYFPMVVSQSGTSGNPITYGVDQTWFAGASWTRPVFDLSVGVWTTPALLANSVNNVVFDNIEIANEQVARNAAWPPNSGISVNGGSNVTIQNCYIHGWSINQPTTYSDFTPSGGIAFYGGSTGGVVKNCTLDGAPEADSGIGVYGGATIQGNIIKNMPNGIYVTDPAATVSGNQIYNVTYSVDPARQQNGIYAVGGGSIYNNLVSDVEPGAYALYMESASPQAANTQSVYNNLVWNAGDNPAITIDPDNMGSGFQSNQLVYNNTLYGGTAGCVSVTPRNSSATNLIVENNHCISDLASTDAMCWFVAGISNDCGPVFNLVAENNIVMTTATATSQGYTLANSFQPTAATNSTVAAGLNLSSRCVSGVSLCSDRLGVPRSSGASAWDVGAYVYQAVPANVLPSITLQPANISVEAGQTGSFSVVATGTGPLNYLWYANGSAISGATSSSYTTPPTTAAGSGTLYTVVVSNSLGSVTSSAATVAVNSTQGQLLASTTNLMFGIVEIGSSSQQGITLTNTSNSFVTITNVSISGAGFDSSNSVAGYILPAGESILLNVTFTPSSSGNGIGSLVLSSDSTSSPLTISLSGSGLQPVSHSVVLGWDANAAPVAGYYIYRSTDFGGPFTKLNYMPVTSTTFTDLTPLAGMTYYYVVTSVDANNVESLFSGQVAAATPVP